jgi:tetratricopeptide (TPR) repeat protein
MINMKKLNSVFAAVVCWAVLFTGLSLSAAQDVVVVQLKGGEKEANKKGTIVDWKGQSLSLKSSLGVKEIDNDKIVRIQTSWSPEYLAAVELMKVDQFAPAIEKFQTAIESENRPWAKNAIRAKIVECALAIESYGVAANRFEEIVREDAQTRFLYLAPMKWASTAGSSNLTALAETWIETSEPTLQLVGASWLLQGITKKQAIAKLEKLAKDFDPKISGLAAAQLWRGRGLSATEKQIDVWIKKLETLPSNLRAGPWYVVAEAQRRAQLTDKAAINFMRIPILYPEQRSLSAAALYQTAALMHNTNRDQEEAILKNELKENFGDTVWAK